MEFGDDEDQAAIREAVAGTCSAFPESYWLQRDEDGVFPDEFHAAMADDGWLGIAMPEEYGGAGLGITEAAVHDADHRRVGRRLHRRLGRSTSTSSA